MKIGAYLIREISFYLILFFSALFFALLCNYISGFLSKAANGYIGLATVLKLLILISPNLMLFVLPMGVFGGVFTAFRKLSIQNELIIFFSSGIPWKKLFFYSLLPVALLTIMTLLLSFVVVPASLRKFENLTDQSAVKSIEYIKPGRFYHLGKNKEVFLDKEKGILFISFGEKKISITYSPSYFLKMAHNQRFLTLNDGWNEIVSQTNESVKNLSFKTEILTLRTPKTTVEHTVAAESTAKLFSEATLKSNVELRWRFFTGFLPLTTLFLVFPFCGSFFKKNSNLTIILAVLCFGSFCIVSSFIKNMLTVGELPLWCGFEILSFIAFLNGLRWIIAKDGGKRIGRPIDPTVYL